MSVGELIKKGFGIALKSKPLIVVLFVFSFVWNLINIPLSQRLQQANVGISLAVVALSLVFILLSVFMQAGTLAYVRDVIKTGKSTLAVFKDAGLKYYLRILAIGVIIGLAVVVLFSLAALVFVVLGNAPNVLKVLIATVFVVAGIAGVLFLFLAPYAAVADEKAVFEAFRSSIDIVKSFFWRLFLTGLVLIVILFVLGFLIGLIIGLLSAILKGAAGQLVTGFLSSLLNAYFGIVVTGTFMSFYLTAKPSAGPGPSPRPSPI